MKTNMDDPFVSRMIKTMNKERFIAEFNTWDSTSVLGFVSTILIGVIICILIMMYNVIIGLIVTLVFVILFLFLRNRLACMVTFYDSCIQLKSWSGKEKRIDYDRIKKIYRHRNLSSFAPIYVIKYKGIGHVIFSCEEADFENLKKSLYDTGVRLRFRK